ncbi:post-transcriptional regulator [Chengkuizengella sp. SCS-71B]|uniref:post-transcriptional regulator n=1 Tax=Chengkuizengella sp. SCS-71B TaxID=3115290 RepID=UPI0032C232D9
MDKVIYNGYAQHVLTHAENMILRLKSFVWEDSGGVYRNNNLSLQLGRVKQMDGELWDNVVEEDSCDTKREYELDEQELSRTIEELCLSKAEEFRMLGYNHVTGHEIWQCISKKYHKDGIPNLHKIVNDILTLKVTNFMNWLTINAYKEV